MKLATELELPRRRQVVSQQRVGEHLIDDGHVGPSLEFHDGERIWRRLSDHFWRELQVCAPIAKELVQVVDVDCLTRIDPERGREAFGVPSLRRREQAHLEPMIYALEDVPL